MKSPASIKYTHFIVALGLLVLMPLSIEWRLLVLGTETVGEIVTYDSNKDPNKFRVGRGHTFAAAFVLQETEYRASVGKSRAYRLGEKVPICYNKANPSNCIVYSINGIYHGWNLAWTGIAFLFWIAGILVFHQWKTGNYQH